MLRLHVKAEGWRKIMCFVVIVVGTSEVTDNGIKYFK